MTMAVEWSGTGPELLVNLDRTGSEPLSAQLQRELGDPEREAGPGRTAAVVTDPR